LNNLSNLAGNALVVMGLALSLSALSYAHWEAQAQGTHFRVVLRSRLCQISCDAGVLLACAGLLVSSRPLWERMVWGAFSLVHVCMGARRLIRRRQNAGSSIIEFDSSDHVSSRQRS
jgi:hypothetical protein